MTADEIRSMPASREMDAVVAYTLFDWRWRLHLAWDVTPEEIRKGMRSRGKYAILCVPHYSSDWLSEPLNGYEEGRALAIEGWETWWNSDVFPKYSTDIAAAWEVVDVLTVRGARLVLEDWREADPSLPIHGWAVYFNMPDGGTTEQIVAATPMLAICRAAMLVSLEDVR